MHSNFTLKSTLALQEVQAPEDRRATIVPQKHSLCLAICSGVFVWVCVSERHPETKQGNCVYEWIFVYMCVSLHKYVSTHTHTNAHTHIHAHTYTSACTLSLTWVIFICCATIPILQPTISVSNISNDTMIPAVVVVWLLLAIFIVVAPPSLAFVSSV